VLDWCGFVYYQIINNSELLSFGNKPHLTILLFLTAIHISCVNDITVILNFAIVRLVSDPQARSPVILYLFENQNTKQRKSQ